MELVVGAIYNGKVTGITKFGAFVSIPELGKSGMVHISEIANTYVNDIKDFLTDGQEVKVKIINIDDAGRINLSIKKAIPPAPPRAPGSRQEQGGQQRERASGEAASFEDKLKQFMADSDSKISGMKIYADRKNSRRRK